AHYHLGSAARFVLYHYGDVVILTAAVPVSALVLLIALRDRSPALRAYVATATALCLWFPIEVGLFASQHVGLLAERNLLPLAPVLFVGLAAWLGLCAPGPVLAAAVAVAPPVALLLPLAVRRCLRTWACPIAFRLFL